MLTEVYSTNPKVKYKSGDLSVFGRITLKYILSSPLVWNFILSSMCLVTIQAVALSTRRCVGNKSIKSHRNDTSKAKSCLKLVK
jgi:hypothetical protein